MNLVDILQFIGIPVLVASLVMVFSWKFLPGIRVQPLGALIAVGASSVIAFSLQEGIPNIPPSQKWHWLVVTVALVSLCACLYPLCRKFDERIVLQATIAGIIAAVLMQFPSQSGFMIRCIVFLMVLVVSISLRRFTIPPWHMFVVSWLILAGLSILALQSSFAKLAFYAGAMSAVAASMCLLQLLKPREIKSIQMIFGVLIVGCSLCGFAYDQNETVFKLAWFLPMVGLPVSAIVYLLLKHPKKRALISLATVFVLVATSVLVSVVGTAPADEMWP
ncbi:MAG: hypothetical protein HOI88_09180 [Phycisphaerae bacterium]|nr:hypothetical protein [Phycisphaerae bacterium]